MAGDIGHLRDLRPDPRNARRHDPLERTAAPQVARPTPGRHGAGFAPAADRTSDRRRRRELRRAAAMAAQRGLLRLACTALRTRVVDAGVIVDVQAQRPVPVAPCAHRGEVLGREATVRRGLFPAVARDAQRDQVGCPVVERQAVRRPVVDVQTRSVTRLVGGFCHAAIGAPAGLPGDHARPRLRPGWSPSRQRAAPPTRVPAPTDLGAVLATGAGPRTVETWTPFVHIESRSAGPADHASPPPARRAHAGLRAEPLLPAWCVEQPTALCTGTVRPPLHEQMIAQ